MYHICPLSRNRHFYRIPHKEKIRYQQLQHTETIKADAATVLC